MDNRNWRSSSARAEPVSVSPDGKRYVVRLVKGDCERNGVWVQVLIGRLGSLRETAQIELAASLFSTGLGSRTGIIGSESDTNDATNPIRWLGNDEVAFLWSDERGIRQAVAIDLIRHVRRFLTDHTSHVRSFDVNPKGVVIYAAEARLPEVKKTWSEAPRVTQNMDAFALLTGDLSGFSYLDRIYNSEWFIKRSSTSPATTLKIAGRDLDLTYFHTVSFSPNGKDVLVGTTAAQIPEDWNKYDRKNSIEQARAGPHKFDARTVYQWFIVDADAGTARLLWPSLANIEGQAKWSPDGRYVLFAPTYLPPASADPDGLIGRAAAIVDARTGAYEVLRSDQITGSIVDIRWVGGDTVALDHGPPKGSLQTTVFRRYSGKWRASHARSSASFLRSRPAVQITLTEAINTPPRLVATDVSSGASALVLDPNPGLTDEFDLGRAETVEGTLPSGIKWSGLIFYPPTYSRDRKYPLLIQSQYGAAPVQAFTLYGPGAVPGLGPTLIAAYPGRTLTSRDVLVLTLTVFADWPNEAVAYQAAFEQAANHLIEAGLVDRERVGLVGFSRNGYFVEYAITHSRFPFAAALSADSWDPSYLPTAMIDWSGLANEVNGGAPFGEGLIEWLKNSPGFNADKIQTPLRIVVQSAGLAGMLVKWELFSRLRHLNKPVELMGIPDFDQGGHNLQNPRQILDVQKGAIEWFDYWLNKGKNPARSVAKAPAERP